MKRLRLALLLALAFFLFQSFSPINLNHLLVIPLRVNATRAAGLGNTRIKCVSRSRETPLTQDLPSYITRLSLAHHPQ